MALAAALVTRPPLVLLDEPTSQLDPVAGDELIWLLRRLNEEWGVAVLLAEHRLERCLAAADRVIAMDSGAFAFDGPPAEFLRWALDSDPALATPSARLFSLAGIGAFPSASERCGTRRAGSSSAQRPPRLVPRVGRPRGCGRPRGARVAAAPPPGRRGTCGWSWTAAIGRETSCGGSTSPSPAESASP